MGSIKEVLNALKEEVDYLIEEKKMLTKHNLLLKEKVETLQQELSLARQKHQEVLNENNRLKVADALQGNAEHRRLMKFKLNKIIKEIDNSIASLKKTTI